jgi:hypothetical protein
MPPFARLECSVSRTGTATRRALMIQQDPTRWNFSGQIGCSKRPCTCCCTTQSHSSCLPASRCHGRFARSPIQMRQYLLDRRVTVHLIKCPQRAYVRCVVVRVCAMRQQCTRNVRRKQSMLCRRTSVPHQDAGAEKKHPRQAHEDLSHDRRSNLPPKHMVMR